MVWVLLRVLFSPLSSVYQKKLGQGGAGSVEIVVMTYAAAGVLFLPAVFLRPEGLLLPLFWGWAVVAAMVDAAGNVMLVKSLETTDISVYGPLNAFKPAVGALLGFVLIGDVMQPADLAFMLVIMAGGLLLSFEGGSIRALWSRGVAWRFGGLAVSALGAVLSRKALQYSHPAAFISLWALLGLPVLLAFLAWRRRGGRFQWGGPQSMVYYPPAVLFYAGMQGATLIALATVPVGTALALFQLSSVLAVLTGGHFFGEKQMLKKLTASLVMTAGAVGMVML